jgi:hypothetical protein
MDCNEAEELFERFICATKNHLDAAEALENVGGSKDSFAEVRLRACDTYAACLAAQSAMKAHREHHNCGRPSVEADLS